MKRFALLVFVLNLLTAIPSSGQSLVVAKSMSDTLVQGDAWLSDMLDGYVSVINVSAQPVDVLMKIDVPATAELVDSFNLSFNGLCCIFGSITPEFLRAELQPGDSLPDMRQALTVFPNRDGIPRKERAKITLFNADDTTDKVVHYITYELVMNLEAQEFIQPAFSVYPNPTNGPIWLDGLFESHHPFLIEVSDLSGRIVGEFELDEFSGYSMDLSFLAPGPYLMSVSDGRQSFGTIRIYLN